jgi:NADH-quinone oxidoreductase subunit J
MIAQYLFYFLSFVSISCALLMIFSKNPVHSVLYLIATFFSIAGHYFLLNAQFLAAVHIIVYAGAIMVLFLYVIMMLNLNTEVEPIKSKMQRIIGVVAGGLFALVLVVALIRVQTSVGVQTINPEMGLIKNLGKILFDEFLLPFEISSVLLLSSMIGAVYLSKKSLTE